MSKRDKKYDMELCNFYSKHGIFQPLVVCSSCEEQNEICCSECSVDLVENMEGKVFKKTFCKRPNSSTQSICGNLLERLMQSFQLTFSLTLLFRILRCNEDFLIQRKLLFCYRRLRVLHNVEHISNSLSKDGKLCIIFI